MKPWLLCLTFLLAAQCVRAAFPKPFVADSAQTAFINQQPFWLKELGSLTVKEYEQRTGKKLSFREKLTFKLLQHRLKKEQKETHKTDVLAAIGGFLLGFVLPFIGVGIAYLLPKNKTLRTWALIGFGVVALLFLIILVLIFTGAIPLIG